MLSMLDAREKKILDARDMEMLEARDGMKMVDAREMEGTSSSMSSKSSMFGEEEVLVLSTPFIFTIYF